MTFFLTTKEMHEDYQIPYLLRKERNIAIAFIFIVPFLAFLNIWFILLTLVPWTIAGVIIVHHHCSECVASQTDAVLMRDGHIEVDQYPSLMAAIHDDRFIDMNTIVDIEVIEYVTVSRRKGEEREARRMLIRLKDGTVYSIDRADCVIRNAVRALSAWNESRAMNANAMFKEKMVDFPPFQCDLSRIGPPEHTGSRRYQIGTAAIFAILATAMFILGLMNGDDANRNPARYVMIWLIILIMVEMTIIMVVDMIEDGLVAPKYFQPYYLHVDENTINVWFFNRPMMSFSWSSLRGIKATSTDGWHHSTEDVDPIFHPSGGKGALVFDDVLFSIDVGIADRMQSIYVEKFGFYPNRYLLYFAAKSPPVHNYSNLLRRPKYGWRKTEITEQ